jgi:tRNA(Arg) A34 adenosine deaminase TadA
MSDRIKREKSSEVKMHDYGIFLYLVSALDVHVLMIAHGRNMLQKNPTQHRVYGRILF